MAIIEVPTYIELIKKVRLEKPHLGLKGAKDLCDSFFGSSSAYHSIPIEQLKEKLEAFNDYYWEKECNPKVTFTDSQLYTLCVRFLASCEDKNPGPNHAILIERAEEFARQYLTRL